MRLHGKIRYGHRQLQTAALNQAGTLADSLATLLEFNTPAGLTSVGRLSRLAVQQSMQSAVNLHSLRPLPQALLLQCWPVK